MSEGENVEVVQQVYRAFGTGDVGALLKRLSADVIWHVPAMNGVPFAGTWQGREGVREFLGTLASAQEVVEFEPERFIAQGESVIVLGRFAMRVKSTDRLSRSEWAHVWTVQDGEVVHFREYVDTAAVSAAHQAPSRRAESGKNDIGGEG